MKRFGGLIFGIVLTAPFAAAGLYEIVHPAWGLQSVSGWFREILVGIATLMFAVVTIHYLVELVRRALGRGRPELPGAEP